MNKFAKYVPEEDKKKQREFIGIDLENMGGGELPFGEELVTILEPVTVVSTGFGWDSVVYNPFMIEDLVVGDTYIVTFDDTEYECVAYYATGYDFAAIGDPHKAYDGIATNPGRDEPFYLETRGSNYGSESICLEALEGTHTMSIVRKVVTAIDEKFIPVKHDYEVYCTDGAWILDKWGMPPGPFQVAKLGMNIMFTSLDGSYTCRPLTMYRENDFIVRYLIIGANGDQAWISVQLG